MDVASSSVSGRTESSEGFEQIQRILVAWMDTREEQLQNILGRQVLPTDDLSALQGLIDGYTGALASRAAFIPTNPLIDTEDAELRERLDGIAKRPDILGALAGLAWRPAVIDLRAVLAFQKAVRVDDLSARVTPALASNEQLLELCFPSSLSLDLSWERNDTGYTIISSNPNFTVAPAQFPPDQVPMMNGMAVFPFVVIPNLNCFMVAHYRDRYFIRDGYHRAVGFLKEGKPIVPCVLVEANSLNQIGWRPGMIREEILFGERPPRLVDFWEDEVSRSLTIYSQAKRKAFRALVDNFLI